MIGFAIVGTAVVLFAYAAAHAHYNHDGATSWLFGSFETVVSRMPIFIVITVLTFLQLLIGSYAVPDSRAEAITSLWNVGPFEFGPYDFVGALLLAWLVGPIAYRSAKYILLARYHSEQYLAEYWGETA